MMPKEVKVNRNTIDAAEAMAGVSSGRVTSTSVLHRPAPSVCDASSMRRSSCSQAVPTVRTTTA